MFLLHRPTDNEVREFLNSQDDQPFSYPNVGASRTGTPPGYNVDHNRIQLGRGEATFKSGVAALRAWTMFDLGWVKLYWPDTPLEVGNVVAAACHHLGFWSLNPSRIVYVIDHDGPVRTFGFAYGTLPDHGERGEERFSIEWRKKDDSVWYDMLAFSKPGPMAMLGYPYVRRLQRRFARDSMRAVVVASSRHHNN